MAPRLHVSAPYPLAPSYNSGMDMKLTWQEVRPKSIWHHQAPGPRHQKQAAPSLMLKGVAPRPRDLIPRPIAYSGTIPSLLSLNKTTMGCFSLHTSRPLSNLHLPLQIFVWIRWCKVISSPPLVLSMFHLNDLVVTLWRTWQTIWFCLVRDPKLLGRFAYWWQNDLILFG